jgi:regulator of sigma E protease
MITDNLLIQIIISLIVISLLVAWHELGHYTMARLTGMRVLRFSIGFGPKVVSMVRKGIEYQISALPIGGFVQIAGMTPLEEGAKEDPKSFINRPRWAQILVIAAGPLFNYILAFFLFISVFWLYSPSHTPSLLVNHLVPDSPAAVAGLQEGDVITHVNGKSLSRTKDFLAVIHQSQGRPINLQIERLSKDIDAKVHQQFLDFQIVPIVDAGGAYRIGVGYVPLSFTFSSAVAESFSQLWGQSTGILSQLGRSIFGKSDAKLGGVVEVTRQLSHAAGQGLKNLLWLMASLSVVLGLFNILPIPALDGSKIFILCLEGVIRRPINATAQLWIHGIGIIFILALMLFLTVSDVLRIYQAG